MKMVIFHCYVSSPEGTILNWSSPLTSGTIGTVGFAASLGPCQPRLTADLDPVWMGNHPISRVSSFVQNKSRLFPVAVWRLAPVCCQISFRMYSSEPRPSYRHIWGWPGDWSMNGFWFRQGTSRFQVGSKNSTHLEWKWKVEYGGIWWNRWWTDSSFLQLTHARQLEFAEFAWCPFCPNETWLREATLHWGYDRHGSHAGQPRWRRPCLVEGPTEGDASDSWNSSGCYITRWHPRPIVSTSSIFFGTPRVQEKICPYMVDLGLTSVCPLMCGPQIGLCQWGDTWNDHVYRERQLGDTSIWLFW